MQTRVRDVQASWEWAGDGPPSSATGFDLTPKVDRSPAFSQGGQRAYWYDHRGQVTSQRLSTGTANATGSNQVAGETTSEPPGSPPQYARRPRGAGGRAGVVARRLDGDPSPHSYQGQRGTLSDFDHPSSRILLRALHASTASVSLAPRTRAQTAADHRLVAIKIALNPTLTMVSRLFLPMPSSDLRHSLDRSVARG